MASTDPIVKIDPYGNTCVTFTVQPTTSELASIVSGCSINKAVIIRGLEKDTVDKYNKVLEQGENYYGKFERNQCVTGFDNVYVIKNQATCPEIYDGHIYAGGTSYIIEFNGIYYAIMVRDMTKLIVTNVGGTFDGKYDSPFDLEVIHEKIARREFLEETTTYASNGSLISPNPINDSIIKLVTVEYLTPLFGMKVPDTYKCYGYFTKFNIEDTFHRSLFDSSNKDVTTGIYSLKYDGHSETDYMFAVPLQKDFVFTVKSPEDFNRIAGSVSDIIQPLPPYSGSLKKPTISVQHLLTNYYHLALILGTLNVTFRDFIGMSDFLKASKMPPSIISLKFEN